MDNLEWYEGWRAVPATACRAIQAGNLRGKTDINPLWRIKVLTERFGPCGVGWYTETVEHWVEEAGGETCAWVRLRLYVRDPSGGEWSRPIEGVGGSKQTGRGRGDGINEEAFKMAETDALSVAAKKLGVGADVYWSADATKYGEAAKEAAPRRDAQERPPLVEALVALQNARDRAELLGAYRRYKPFHDGDPDFDGLVRAMSQKYPKP